MATKDYRQVKVSAPSKIILHGEHAVVYGKTAVAASIGLRTSMTFTPKGRDHEGPHIRLHFPGVEIEDSWSYERVKDLLAKRPSGYPEANGKHRKRKLSDTQDEDGGLDSICWFSSDQVDTEFTLEICKFLGVDKANLRMSSLICFFYLYSLLSLENKSITFPPIEISIDSEIPIGVGLGSSAALSVCLAAGLLAIRDQISGSQAIITNETRLAEICQLARLSEQILHGRCSGLDNAVSTYGGLVQFENLARVDGTELSKALNLRILLVGTKVPRNTKHLVESVRKDVKEFPDIVQPIIEAIDGVSRDCLDTLRRMETAKDLTQSYKRLERLIDLNQGLLATLGVSHPALDEVCKLAAENELHAKLTGAGGGGYAFVLIPPYINEEKVLKTVQSLQKANFDCWETELGVKGVTISLS